MKKRLIRISLCLLLSTVLGVATTVGVAWGLAWLAVWGPPSDSQNFADPRYADLWTEARPAGAPEVPASWTKDSDTFVIMWTGITSSRGEAEQIDLWTLFWIESGWPAPALEGGEWRVERTQRSFAHTAKWIIGSAGSFYPIGYPAGNTSALRLLPLRPIFPGFLVNTLFYAAIWFGIFFGVAALRRAIRRGRGRCVKCGYDLRGHHSPHPHPQPLSRGERGVQVGCPECGWNREEEQAMSDE